MVFDKEKSLTMQFIQLFCLGILILAMVPVLTVKADTHENSNRFITSVKGGYHQARVTFTMDG